MTDLLGNCFPACSRHKSLSKLKIKGIQINTSFHSIYAGPKLNVHKINISAQFKLPTNCLSVFGHFKGLALKGLSFGSSEYFLCYYFDKSVS